jgi:hypothetical protein
MRSVFGVLLVDISTPVARLNCFSMSPTATLLKRKDHVLSSISEACDELEKKMTQAEHKVTTIKNKKVLKLPAASCGECSA